MKKETGRGTQRCRVKVEKQKTGKKEKAKYGITEDSLRKKTRNQEITRQKRISRAKSNKDESRGESIEYAVEYSIRWTEID